MTEAQISSSPFSVSAADGYWLKGVRFAPAEKPKAVIVVADVVNDGEMADAVVKNAPATEDHYFLVPKVVE